jgi:hypothetical protein
MLKFVRARTSSVAAALLVSLLSLQLPHPADADHDSHASLHCVVCHLARSFRPQADPSSLPVPVVSTGTHAHLEVFTAARPAPLAQPPLRSPPPSPIFTPA